MASLTIDLQSPTYANKIELEATIQFSLGASNPI